MDATCPITQRWNAHVLRGARRRARVRQTCTGLGAMVGVDADDR
jgi:hypothetical protein